MQLHDPQISWIDKEITHWSSHYFNHCLQTAQLSLASTTMECPENSTPVETPIEYQDLKEVFSKTKASTDLMAVQSSFCLGPPPGHN